MNVNLVHAALSFGWGLILIFSSVNAAELISANAGRVGDYVVTTREVMINHMIENALVRYKKGQVPKPTLKLDKIKDRDFVRETTAVLLETAIYFEAESFSAAAVADSTVSAQARLVRDRLRHDSLWKKLQVAPEELQKILRRKLRAKDFIKFKIDSATIPISDREAREYFENNRLKFENLQFENFKDNIKAYLTKQQVDKRLKDWFELLQSKYRVRNYLSE